MTHPNSPVQKPQRFTPKKGGALAALVGLPAAVMLYQMVPEHEGVVLKGYKDPIGIPTKCMGDTRDVVLGKRYSIEECAARRVPRRRSAFRSRIKPGPAR